MAPRNDGTPATAVPVIIAVNKMPTDEAFIVSDIHDKTPGICENFSTMLEDLNDCLCNRGKRGAGGDSKSVSEKTTSTISPTPEEVAVDVTHGGFFNCGKEKNVKDSVDDDKSPVVDIDTSNGDKGLQSPLSDITTGIPGPAACSVSSFSAESVTPKKLRKHDQKKVELEVVVVKDVVEQQENEQPQDANEEEQKEQEEKPENKTRGRWVSVQDPLSGRTYFFNSFTRQTTWTDPGKELSATLNENVPLRSTGDEEEVAPQEASENVGGNKAGAQSPNASKEKTKSTIAKAFFKRLSMKVKKSKRSQNEAVENTADQKNLSDKKSLRAKFAEQHREQEEDDWMSLRDPDAWVEAKDPTSGHKYFYNILTRKSTWTDVVNLIGENMPPRAPEEDVIKAKPKSDLSHLDVEIGEELVRVGSDKSKHRTETFEARIETFEAKVETGEEIPQEDVQSIMEKPVPKKPTWVAVKGIQDGNKVTYYYNRKTKATSWTKPDEYDKDLAVYQVGLERYHRILTARKEAEFAQWRQSLELGSQNVDTDKVSKGKVAKSLKEEVVMDEDQTQDTRSRNLFRSVAKTPLKKFQRRR